MGVVNEFVDKVYLINLDRREDMLAHASEQCAKIGVEFERISATDGRAINPDEVKTYPGFDPKYWNVGALGLVRTTRRIIEDAIEKKYNKIMILEDDVIFGDSFLEDFLQLKKIPLDWHFFNFGVQNAIAPQKVSGTFGRTIFGFCLHCYMVHEPIFEFYLHYLKKEEKQLDFITAEDFQPMGTSYSFLRNNAFQKEKYSDINNEVANRDFLLKN